MLITNFMPFVTVTSLTSLTDTLAIIVREQIRTAESNYSLKHVLFFLGILPKFLDQVIVQYEAVRRLPYKLEMPVQLIVKFGASIRLDDENLTGCTTTSSKMIWFNEERFIGQDHEVGWHHCV